MNINLLGIDIAKEVFQVCGATKGGKIVLRKKLKRNKLMEFIAQTPPCCVVMEACGGSNYWARLFEQVGHEVKLIAPQYVKPFVKGNKNDNHDAEAIVEAASRPEMRFVSVKTIERQDWQSLLRVRESYIKMRTQTSNRIRGLLAEYGVVMKQGLATLRKKLPVLFDEAIENELTPLMKTLLKEQYDFLLKLDEQIEGYDFQLTKLTEKNECCQRLMAIEGIGIITVVALFALVGTGQGFKNGRHFAAFLGLVPRQHSSGGKERLLKISKRGDETLRRLMIHGARSVVIRAGKKSDKRSQWVTKLQARCGINKTCVAVANKNARIAMAILLSGESYRKAA